MTLVSEEVCLTLRLVIDDPYIHIIGIWHEINQRNQHDGEEQLLSS